MDPLLRRLDALRELGQGLIEAAGSGVNTGTLESELESINEKWAHLNERVRMKSYCFVIHAMLDLYLMSNVCVTVDREGAGIGCHS